MELEDYGKPYRNDQQWILLCLLAAVVCIWSNDLYYLFLHLTR